MRRAVAAVMMLFLLQWIGGGIALGCDMSAQGAKHGAMAGMSMQSHDAGATRSPTHPGGGHEQRCDGSGATTAAQCVVAAGCAVTIAVAPSIGADTIVVVASTARSSIPDAPASWSARPELPPPRA
ncbi:MAG: hypothetical protein HOQ11_01260 [Gemmatimonadaceae bacterium]|nr:hypothetical protein [Gemmatimonadaceae bacterium]NUQ94111.1 hypothetical protein [Gemmatimonadaceae bacterium]NUR18019.1 hypothetical protein [Gemmatimonadaceae bacterium]NUS96016.1 hypothetical protein [Gemmatimonadaceae bacterium]